MEFFVLVPFAKKLIIHTHLAKRFLPDMLFVDEWYSCKADFTGQKYYEAFNITHADRGLSAYNNAIICSFYSASSANSAVKTISLCSCECSYDLFHSLRFLCLSAVLRQKKIAQTRLANLSLPELAFVVCWWISLTVASAKRLIT